MSGRSDSRSDEVKQKSDVVTEQLNQFVVIIGGSATAMSKKLAKVVGRGSKEFQLNLQTKYYSNAVSVVTFPTLAQYNSWKTRTVNIDQVFVGALFAIIENGSDQLLNEFYIHKLDVVDLQIQSKAVVMDKEEDMSPVEEEKCDEWCTTNGFEKVYMTSSEEALHEAFKNREKLGDARLEELLHVVDWPLKKIDTPRLTGHHRLDYVINALESLSDSDDDDAIPNEEERAGIYEFLGMTQVPSHQNGNSSGRVVEASVDVNVALKGGVISSVSVNSDADGGKRQGKAHKGKSGNKGTTGNGGKQGKDNGGSRPSIGAEVSRTIRISSGPTETSPIIAEKEAEEGGSHFTNKEDLPDLATLFNSVKEMRSLNMLNGWEEGEMRVGGAVGVMDRLCKDLLGEEGLMEEVKEIERLKREGKYVENEDSD